MMARPLSRAQSTGLVRRVIARGRRALFRQQRLLLYVAPLASIRHEGPRLDAGWTYECRELDTEAARTFCDAPDEVLRNLRSYLVDDVPGQRVLLVFVNGELAGWCIVCTGPCAWPLSETETELHLEAADAIFISAFTLPHFRGRLLNRTLMGETARVATRLGATRLWAWHVAGNEAPRKNMLHVGMTQVGQHARTWVLGVRLAPHVDLQVAGAHG